ncbi:NUDIX domain-containing protein [Pseudonocardia hispaniensis]|uniref:NUDIX domain-containing protein n=1 Tax=Pseudonocardia hispaniensis TaxID=904933 RepID=A0ABW1J828_9PSEU
MSDVVTAQDTAGVDVLAAGAVLWRFAEDDSADPAGLRVALVHRPRYDDWSLPKGKLDAGETLPAAAVREVTEETGCHLRLGERLGDVRYAVAGATKLVRYWAGQARSGGPGFSPNHETDELRWLSPAEAMDMLSYDRDREILGRFAARPVPNSVLVLVRHAKAGARRDWTGEDALRPLSPAGHAQVTGLTTLLSLFGPDRVHSAPPMRCRQTVIPLAARLGLDVVDEPLLGDIGYQNDPAASLARLHDLAALPGVTVLSSQGAVIPWLVDRLTAEAGLTLALPSDGDIPAAKGSSWVLGSRDGRTLFADHYPTPTG